MQLLTSTQSLVLQAITWKVRLQRKRGNSGLVTVTSHLLAEFLTEKFKADVSPRAVSNALKALHEFGYLIKRESQREGFKVVFAYGLPESLEAVPVVFFEKSAMTSEVDAVSSTTSAMSSAEYSVTPSNKVQDYKKSISQVPTANYTSSGLSSKVVAPQGVRSLAEIARLCDEKGQLPSLPVRRCKDGYLVKSDQNPV